MKVVGPSHPLSLLTPCAVLPGPQNLGLKCPMAEQLLEPQLHPGRRGAPLSRAAREEGVPDVQQQVLY